MKEEQEVSEQYLSNYNVSIVQTDPKLLAQNPEIIRAWNKWKEIEEKTPLLPSTTPTSKGENRHLESRIKTLESSNRPLGNRNDLLTTKLDRAETRLETTRRALHEALEEMQHHNPAFVTEERIALTESIVEANSEHGSEMDYEHDSHDTVEAGDGAAEEAADMPTAARLAAEAEAARASEIDPWDPGFSRPTWLLSQAMGTRDMAGVRRHGHGLVERTIFKEEKWWGDRERDVCESISCVDLDILGDVFR